MRREQNLYLLREESSKLDEMLWDWFTLTYQKRNPKIREKIFATKTKVYAEYENFPYFAFQRAMTEVRIRWARLPKSLKKSEPHSPINLEETLYKVPKYLELGK